MSWLLIWRKRVIKLKIATFPADKMRVLELGASLDETTLANPWQRHTRFAASIGLYKVAS